MKNSNQSKFNKFFHKRISNHNNPKSCKEETNNSKSKLKILQININGIQNKFSELKQIVADTSPDVITIQESKLNIDSHTLNMPGYITIRKDRSNKIGGGLITYVKDEISFTEIESSKIATSDKQEIIIIRINLTSSKKFHITNMYLPPRDTNTSYLNEDKELEQLFNQLLNLQNNIITGDMNAHSNLWHSTLIDHRGKIISDIIQNSDHIAINMDTPTQIPFDKTQKTTSPDVTFIPNEFSQNSTWNTNYSLNSDHLPITTVINTKTNFKLIQYRNSYTNYKKANWKKYHQQFSIIIIIIIIIIR